MKETVFTLILIIFLCAFSVGCEKEDPEEEIEYYTVTFIGKDGNVISISNVEKGADLSDEVAPNIAGFKFIGWDKDISNITSDIEVRALYEKIIIYYNVKFYCFDELVKDVDVVASSSIDSPTPVEKEGYKFIGWDKEFSKVESDLIIHAVYEEIKEEVIKYTSYVDGFRFNNMENKALLIQKIINPSNLVRTYTTVISGGFRGTNELHYYDKTNMVNRNAFGFEIAVDSNNVVIEKATIVNLPDDGFILSGHGTSADYLADNISIGSVVVMENSNTAFKVYKNSKESEILGLGIDIEKVVNKVYAFSETLTPLDYQGLMDKINDTINKYNELISTYNSAKLNEAKTTILQVSFMLIETTPIGVRAMWHYPLRMNNYKESNTESVQAFLDKVKSTGINRIYLNTNFNGKGIYKSEYLSQTLTNYNTYTGYKDYLECFITEAHLRNIEVYAWTNTLIAGDGVNNTFYSSRGWLLTSYNNNNNQGGMYFVDISNDDVRTFLNNVFDELSSNYDLDGIEFDFIRYPSGNLHTYSGIITNTASIEDWGYTESFINKFMNSKGYTGDLRELIKNNQTIRTEFLDFKRNLLTSTVEMITTTIKSNNSNMKIAAAVMPSINTARNTYLQDWKTWIEADYVDVLEPMIYTSDNKYLIDTLNSMISVVNGNADIVVGIFPEGSGGTADINASQIILIEELNISGWSKFSSRQIFNNSILNDAIDGMYRSYQVLPSATKQEKYQAYYLNLYDQVSNYYQYASNDEGVLALLDLLNEIKDSSDINSNMNNILSKINSISNQKIKDNLTFLHNKTLKML